MYLYAKYVYIGAAKYLIFILENALKKKTEYILKFVFFLFESTILPSGHAVAYTIDSIFNHIIDCVQPYFTNGFTSIVNNIY